MQVAPQITFRDMEPSAAVEAVVREKMEKLELFYDRITSCKAVVGAPHRRQRNGKLYSIGLEITLPQGKVVVSHDPQKDRSHEDVYIAIRDAFNAAYRQLEDYQRLQRGALKAHSKPH